MLLGIASAFLIAGAGLMGLYLLRIVRGHVGLGLAPGLGVAILAVLSSRGLQFNVPEAVAALVILGVCV